MTTRKRGRPTAGLRRGEKVSDYAPLTVRLPPQAHADLVTAMEVTHNPAWRVVAEALRVYLRRQP